MATFQQRSAQRAAREAEEQRRKNAQYLDMMDEVEDSESDSEDDVIALPTRRGTTGGGRGGSLSAGAGGAGAGGGGGYGGARPQRRTLNYGAAFAGTGAPVASSSKEPELSAEEKRAHRAFRASNSLEAASAPAPQAARGGKEPEAPDGKSFVNTAALRPMVQRPLRRGDAPRQCYVIRNRSGRNMIHPLYTLYSEDGGRFMMAAKKRMGNRTSNYLIAMDPKPTDRTSPNIVGKLRANWSGSGYAIYDEGINPEKAVTDTAVRKELGIVTFEYDKMGPGRMVCALPRVTEGGRAVVFKPMEAGKGIDSAIESKDAERVMFLRNKRPKWDESVGGHVLNFHGRVTMSSVKNFQLGCDELGDDTVLQFGRVDKHKFTMDYRYPLSAVQAFAICLATLDGKIADTKGFEAMRDAAASAGSKLSAAKSKLASSTKK